MCKYCCRAGISLAVTLVSLWQFRHVTCKRFACCLRQILFHWCSCGSWNQLLAWMCPQHHYNVFVLSCTVAPTHPYAGLLNLPIVLRRFRLSGMSLSKVLLVTLGISLTVTLFLFGWFAQRFWDAV
eukprot:GHUV01014548.1.p1 GENE.GHUV01014548.1~~GHUV01014548.1.p1  ORF type:complete len:126 (+),score=7.56 GHUV01014548.1:2162-2539(+)